MRKFLIRRFFAGILSVLAATAIVFALSRAAGDPLLLYAKPGGYGVTPEQEEALKKKLRLDRPLVVQYLLWVTDLLRGDFGRTLLAEQLVTRVVGEKMGATVQLGVVSWVLATIMGVPLGVLSAVLRGSVWDYMGRAFALVGQSLPTFWLGLMMILIFNKQLGWLPFGTRGTTEAFFFSWENLRFFVMPAFAVAWGAAAVYLRLTRSAMLEVLDSEFVKLARSKGVGGTKIIWKHAFRNALIPPLTVSSLMMAGLITGSVVIEAVFSWPGLGRLAIQAVQDNDFPILTATVLFFAVVFVTVNFVTDVLYAVIDPRIRY